MNVTQRTSFLEELHLLGRVWGLNSGLSLLGVEPFLALFILEIGTLFFFRLVCTAILLCLSSCYIAGVTGVCHHAQLVSTEVRVLQTIFAWNHDPISASQVA
jgi:hypothetical protein